MALRRNRELLTMITMGYTRETARQVDNITGS